MCFPALVKRAPTYWSEWKTMKRMCWMQYFLPFGEDEVKEKLLSVCLCICKFESVPLFTASNREQYNVWNLHIS